MEPTNDCRHHLEHVGLTTEDQLIKCGTLGVTTSILADHLHFYGETFILGKDRTDYWASLATAV